MANFGSRYNELSRCYDIQNTITVRQGSGATTSVAAKSSCFETRCDEEFNLILVMTFGTTKVEAVCPQGEAGGLAGWLAFSCRYRLCRAKAGVQ
jgi:hypothetical protein